MSATHTTLQLVRHGQTDWNEAGRLMGRSDAIGINARGRVQVELLARRLADRRPDLLLTSPRRRTRETAAVIAAAHGVAVTPDDALDEVWLGERWQGKTFAEIAGDPDVTRWLADPMQRSDVIEAAADVQRRVVPVLERVRALPAGSLVVAVSHGDPLRLLLAHVLGMAIGDYRRLAVPPASLSVVQIEAQSARLLALAWRPDPLGPAPA
jgi:broad specificity phosphatase PhoE